MSRQGVASLEIWGAWGGLGLPKSSAVAWSCGDGISKHGPVSSMSVSAAG